MNTVPTWVKVLIGLLGTPLVLLFFFWMLCLNFVENYEFGYKFDKWTGERAALVDSKGNELKGWIRTPPWVSIYTLDLRPTQVCINANNRVLNCKLVQFDMKGFDELMAWHGMQDYSNGGAGEGANLSEILKSYAYNSNGGKDCPFLKILQEVRGEDGSTPHDTVPSPFSSPTLIDTTSSK